MLKDLDDRQSEQQVPVGANVQVINKASSKKGILITIVVMLIANGLFFFVWQLYQENQLLKETNTTNNTTTHVSQSVNRIPKTNNDTNLNPPNLASQPTIEVNSNTERAMAKQVVVKTNTVIKDIAIKETVSKNNNQIEQSAKEQSVTSNSLNSSPIKAYNVNPEITPIIKEVYAEPLLDIKKKSSLTISRKQVSPQDLIKQKLSAAEQALSSNDIMKAESLFEEILLLDENRHSARKQLAALWFGRKLYQPALNLLSQGLRLNHEDSELRLMKARIYLNLGQTEKAYKALVALPKTNTVEYQSLLASLAQQLGQFTSAISSYSLLLDMESHSGRWWLGLAIAYDSNSNFDLALPAYKKALEANNLTVNTAEFAQQRIVELGD